MEATDVVASSRLPTKSSLYAALLARPSTVRARRPAAQALFWPKVGRLYDGDLLVIGRW